MPRQTLCHIAAVAIAAAAGTSTASAATYLNASNISVVVGAGTSSGSFNNTFSSGRTIQKAIDAPSADAAEFHDQATHIWFTAAQSGGGLELVFDFGQEYDLSILHFWNYNGEAYDVDNIDFSFFDGSNTAVGGLSLTPALGSTPAIYAQDIALAAPINVRYVNAFLSGDNREVDFQNIGFTASVSAPVPEPATLWLMALGALTVLSFPGLAKARRQTGPG